MIQTLVPPPSEPDTRMPHVLLVVDQFPETLGGGERIVLRLAALLPLYGFRTSVLTFFIHPKCSLLAQPPSFPLYLLPLRRTYDLTALRAAFELGNFIRRQQVRIVQTFFESSDIWAGLVTKALSGAKLIWSRRDMGILRSGKHRLAYRLLAPMPDLVFAVSERVRQHCITHDHVSSTQVVTVYNGIDLDLWNYERFSRNKSNMTVVTTVGNLRRVKGHDLFIRAAALIAEQFPETSFSIAGEILEPEYFAELQTLVRELDLCERFHFLHGVKDLPAHLESATLFILPSRSEGFSNAILEAMASGLSVIATSVGGNIEQVEDGVTGLIVPPEDHAALAAAMAALLSDPERAAAMGRAGRVAVTRKFSTASMLQQISDAYAGLLSQPGSSSF